MVNVPRYRFEKLVRDALDGLPPHLSAAMDNVVIQIEDRHPDEPDLLGLYDGVPLTERGDGSLLLPDVIWIYRLALCELCEDEDHLADEVRVTVVHEVAHHFGIDDDRLIELGWD
jgi:predicted Zn-dependent protease with MMP-like domain